MIFNDYYRSMDESPDPGNPHPLQEAGIPMEEKRLPNIRWGPKQIGTGSNPFQHQLQALNARIKEGAGRIELQFPGTGKGSSQTPTPESYGRQERRAMKDLAKINKVETMVHASFRMTGLAGLSERGFSDMEAENNMKELKKAIEFAAEATTGGAVVMHMGEFSRDMGVFSNEGFSQFPIEAEKEGFQDKNKRNRIHHVVDDRNGRIIASFNEAQEFFEPEFETAASKGIVGKKDSRGRTLNPNDFVDIEGNYLDPAKPEDMFNRLVKYNPEQSSFGTKKVTWDEIENRAKEWNQAHPDQKLTAAQYKAREEILNQALTARANSVYSSSQYEDLYKAEQKLSSALKSYEVIEKEMPLEEQWKIMRQKPLPGISNLGLTEEEYTKPTELIKSTLKEVQNKIKVTHQQSADADAKYQEYKSAAEHIKPIEEVGLERSTENLARAGIFAMNETQRWKPDKPVYIAPENVWTGLFGSHPAELIKLVKGSREKMSAMLQEQKKLDKATADAVAKKHIKSTFDIGHINNFKQYWKPDDPNISAAQRDKEFKKLVMKWTKEMIKEDIIGHVHVSDNFGYDDEHLTPGEGNSPIKEFLQEIHDSGATDDIIVETGSFNPLTGMTDTWQWFDSPIYSAGPSRNFSSIKDRHFGMQAPPFYVVGGYAPSNDWRLWSEVPFE